MERRCSPWRRLPFQFGSLKGTAPLARTMIHPDHHSWRVHRDLASDESVLEVINDQGVWHIPDIDLTVEARAQEWYNSCGNDVGSVRGETLWQRRLERGEWGVRTVTRSVLTATAQEFHVRADLDAYEKDSAGERRVMCRSWERKIPRDCV